MKYIKHSCSIFILALAVFVSWSCATTGSSSTKNKTSGSNAVAQTTGKQDYASQRIDADISSCIKKKFATDELLSDSNLNIDTDRGNVILRGKLNTQAEADRAIQLGRSVSGVRTVHSDFSVKQARITFR